MPKSFTDDSYGQELMQIRLLLNLTQPEFAKALGTTLNTIGRYERGDRHVPEPTMRFARTLLPKSGPKAEAYAKDWTIPSPAWRGKGRPRGSAVGVQGDE